MNLGLGLITRLSVKNLGDQGAWWFSPWGRFEGPGATGWATSCTPTLPLTQVPPLYHSRKLVSGKILFEERMPLLFFFLSLKPLTSPRSLDLQKRKLRPRGGKCLRSLCKSGPEPGPELGSGSQAPSGKLPTGCATLGSAQGRASCSLCLSTSSAFPHACLDNFLTCSFTSSP